MTLVGRTAVARTPWPVVTTALAAAALVLVVAARWPESAALPFAGRIAAFALAGSAAYLLDDAAAPLTDIAPRGPWRRRAPVLATGAVLIAGAWLGVLLVLDWRGVRPPVPESSAEIVVVALVAVAVATLLLRLGETEPGVVVAPVVALAGLGSFVVEALVRAPVLLTSADPSAGRVAGWAAAGTTAVAVILFAPPGPSARTAVREVTPWRKRRTGVR